MFRVLHNPTFSVVIFLPSLLWWLPGFALQDLHRQSEETATADAGAARMPGGARV